MVVTVVLGAWCVLGTAVSVRAFIGPTGWRVERPAAAAGVVGVPLPGAREVTSIQRLLPESDASQIGDWVVLLAPDTEASTLAYIRFQLAYLRYPGRVDVLDVRDFRGSPSYVGAIVAPRFALGAPWKMNGRSGEYTRYVRTDG